MELAINIDYCCAPAATGHVAATPSNVMNSRRFIAMTRKPKEHPEYSRSRPCIAAKEVRSCPLWVIRDQSVRSPQWPHVRFTSNSD